MIIAFVGTPGSGKSYDAVNEVVANLKIGRVVYTNIEGMEQDQCKRYMQDLLGFDDYEFKTRFNHLTDTEMKNFWNLTLPGSLIVIDEAHRLFNSREWQSASNKEFCDWASVHRHQGYDCYIITQDLEKIDKQARSLVEWTYHYRQVNFLGRLFKNRSYLKYAYSGDDTRGKPLNTITRNYNRQIFNCYKSFSNDANLKLGIMPQVNILKHPVFFAIPLVVLAFLYMFFNKSSFATGDLFGSEKIAKRNDTVKNVSVLPHNIQGSGTPIVNPTDEKILAIDPQSRQSSAQQQDSESVKNVSVASAPVSGSAVVGSIKSGKIYKLLLADGRIVDSKVNLSIGFKYTD